MMFGKISCDCFGGKFYEANFLKFSVAFSHGLYWIFTYSYCIYRNDNIWTNILLVVGLRDKKKLLSKIFVIC